MNGKEYKTEQKNIILSYLVKNFDKHLTVDDIVSGIKQEGLSVGKTTVYRYLDRLTESGSIRKFISDDGKSSCYQYTKNQGQCKNHYHLKCTSCSRLIHVDCESIDKVFFHMQSEHDFIIDVTRTIFYGICSECRQKYNKS